jgi:hypothetical protein
MFGQESKIKLKELLVYTAEQEIQIEKLRQILCAIGEFEPYTAFKRIDRANIGLIDSKAFC